MRRLFAVGLLAVFAIAFGIGILASPAMAGPGPPYPAPDNCYWDCHNSHWDLCCENVFGQVRCAHSFYYCFGG